MKAGHEAKPKYLPPIVVGGETSLPESSIETLALVLSGIDPTEKENPACVGKDLRKLASDSSTKRIGTSSSMRDDHMYILSPLFDFSNMTFDDLWQDAKEVPSGQASTDLLKLMKQLSRLELNSEGSQQHAEKNAETIRLVHENAHKLLYRIHRTAVRHVEEALQKPIVPKVEPWYHCMLARLGLVRRDIPTSVIIDPETLDVARRYLAGTIKLGRVLRLPVRKT